MMTTISVRKSITVNTSQQHAFDVFVHRQELWWGRDKCLGEAPLQRVVVEPHVGGRWYEIDNKGDQCMWGKVVAYEPSSRVVFAWQISAQWQYDPAIHTELEVRFSPEGNSRTLVELEHRGLEAYGDEAENMRAMFESPGAWESLLALFAESANA